MKTQRFGEFSFDLINLELRRRGRRVALRPKTAAVLRELLLRRGQVVGKLELIGAVWHSEQVPDQSLFQAMSELRKILAPLAPVKTHPNRGYQWTAHVAAASGRVRLALAAGIAALATCTALVVSQSEPAASSPNTAQVASGLSPALAAFTRGLAQLELGRAVEAERYFRLSMEENPDFHEAQLLLSEALLRQGAIEEARQRAMTLIDARSDHLDAYTVIGAMDLISRSGLAAGQSSIAVEWAVEAASQAHDGGFMCTAADLDERLAALLGDLPVDVPMVAVQITARAESAPERCREIRRPGPETGHLAPVSVEDLATFAFLCAGPGTGRLRLV